MKIYLAGPDVFLPDAIAIGQRKREICQRHGVTGLYPLDNTVDLTAPTPRCRSSRASKR
jgi:nucleoside 2-deoxyribosyltransferase